MASGAQVDLTQLSVEHLQEIRKQLDQELEHLTNSHQALRQAKAKFLSCIESINSTFKPSVSTAKHVDDENDDDDEEEGGGGGDGKSTGKEILVPLTSSLYVPGSINTASKKVIVDVGTGYFIEKPAPDAVRFYEGKIASLTTNLSDLEKIIHAKGSNIQTVTEVMTEKMRQSHVAPSA